MGVIEVVPVSSGETGVVLKPFGHSQLPYDLTDLDMTWLTVCGPLLEGHRACRGPQRPVLRAIYIGPTLQTALFNVRDIVCWVQ